MYSRQKRHGCRPGSRRRTIAFLMLAPCSASSMLSAPLRPGRRPGLRGIDHASARHVFSNYAMVCNLSITPRWLTRESRRRMLTSSRRCRMALPPFAATAYGARIRPAPKGHGIERNPQKSQSDARRPRVVRRRRLSCETSGPLAAHHPQDHAPRGGCVHQRHCPGRLNATDGRHSRSSPRGA
jgi:hypothetical protein